MAPEVDTRMPDIRIFLHPVQSSGFHHFQLLFPYHDLRFYALPSGVYVFTFRYLFPRLAVVFRLRYRHMFYPVTGNVPGVGSSLSKLQISSGVSLIIFHPHGCSNGIKSDRFCCTTMDLAGIFTLGDSLLLNPNGSSNLAIYGCPGANPSIYT